MKIIARDKIIEVGKKTLIMGIVNTSPDSFSGDGVATTNAAINQAKQFLKDGADIVDIGGESTRPGSDPVGETEEVDRVVPVVATLARETNAIISVDTYKATVAKAALEAGVHIINDISGLSDPKMAVLIAQYHAGVVIMHMQGTPKTMQQNPTYEDVIGEINQFFCQRISRAIEFGVGEDHIILDPGIGFGKTLQHNLTILKHLNQFSHPFHDDRTFPVMIGTSRKGFIGKLTGRENPQDRVFGTAASVAIGVANGASLVRVHDVAEIRDVIIVADAISKTT